MYRFLTRRAVRARGKALWAGLLRTLGMLGIAKSLVRHNGIIVLTFHRVLTEGELQQTSSLRGMIVKGDTFDEFLRYAATQCEIIDLAREPEWRPGTRLKIAITFDDGWSDNATTAFAIARKYGAPMTIFIVPSRTGAILPFWPERVATALIASAQDGKKQALHHIERVIEDFKNLPRGERARRTSLLMGAATKPKASIDTTMTWEQIAQLQNAGVTVGSHTATHEILTRIPEGQAREEIFESRRLIERRLGVDCLLFSYPNGDWSPSVRELAATAGYKLGFLNQKPGVWTQSCDPYLVPRANVCESHLVDVRGRFSPLIFEYAVVWQAFRGMVSELVSAYLRRLTLAGGARPSVRRREQQDSQSSFPR